MTSDSEYQSRWEQLNRHRKVGRLSPLESLLTRFTTGERVLLYVCAIVGALSAFALLVGVSRAVSVEVPARGGTITEGVIGPTRFINPLIALSQSDQDIAALVYSGLTRTLPDGHIIPDLASSYEISDDGTVYTFHLRRDATFHDGAEVLAADVAFTIQKAKDPDIKSSHRADWEGVSVATPDAYTIVFTLPHPYAPFLENTSIGILPKHLWKDIPNEEFPFSQLNTHPVGTGPYRIHQIRTDATDVPTRYELVPFKHFALGEAYIKKFVFLFYTNEDALVAAYNAGTIDGIAGISPEHVAALKKRGTLLSAPLPRTFGIFFNQSKNPVLADPAVRKALNETVDKGALVRDVLRGFGYELEGPIPPGVLEPMQSVSAQLPVSAQTASTTPDTERIARAKQILISAGWTFEEERGIWTKKKDVLELSLATADEPGLTATANTVAESWRAAGVRVNVHVYPISELNTAVIRPRTYDAVLFGEVVGRTADLFAFWHSSQRNDPGLNVALYANTKTDALLTQARGTTDKKTRAKLYTQFDSLVMADMPALFLYAPQFLYVVPSHVSGIAIGSLTSPSERFANVYQWYIDTERVWELFTSESNNYL